MSWKHSLTPCTKINSKWIKDLNIRPENIKLLEEYISRRLFNIIHSDIFGPFSWDKKNKSKIIHLGPNQTLIFCVEKETIAKMKKKKKREREYLQMIWPNINSIYCSIWKNNLIKTWKEDMNRLIFFQRRYTESQEAHEKMLNMNNLQRNVNPYCNKVWPNNYQNGYHQHAYK